MSAALNNVYCFCGSGQSLLTFVHKICDPFYRWKCDIRGLSSQPPTNIINSIPLTIYWDYSSRNCDLYWTYVAMFIFGINVAISSRLGNMQNVPARRPLCDKNINVSRHIDSTAPFNWFNTEHQKNWYTSPADEWLRLIYSTYEFE